MQFKYHQISEWPVLSWAIVMEKNNKDVNVYHGNWVETNEGFFTDGAWDGPFNTESIDASFSFMGFIVKTNNSAIMIYTPSHNLERLFFYKTDAYIFCSPSLPLLLTIINKNLDNTYQYYTYDFLNYIRTINNYHDKLRIENNKYIDVLSYNNIIIDIKLAFNIIEKRKCKPFTDYTNYKEYMLDSIEKIHENTQSNLRKNKYSLITTISGGYDSPASSVLVKEKGCKEALALLPTKYDTYTWKSRDDGSDIASKLGLKVYKVPRSSHLERHDMPEAEFFATGYDAMDIVMVGFEKYIKKRILVTGVIGDGVWSKNKKILAPNAVLRPDSCGSALTEFRFRVGFIHLPVPYIGLSAAESIQKISNSKEMYPWTLGSKYDRPIPRRIVEEQGVDRECFGMKKAGSMSFRFSNYAFILKKSMTNISFDDFEKTYKSIIKHRLLYKQLLLTFVYLIIKICGRIDYMFSYINIKTYFKNIIPRKYGYSPLRSSCFLIWSVPLIQRRYKIKGLRKFNLKD